MNVNNDDQDARTIFCGNLNPRVTEEILYELFIQAGPLEKVRIPTDRENKQQSFGFITYKHQCSVPYALGVFECIELFDNRIYLRPRKMESFLPKIQNMFVRSGTQSNMNANVNKTPSPNRTPSGRHDHYKKESLQGRYQLHNKRDRDMTPNENSKRNNKRHKR